MYDLWLHLRGRRGAGRLPVSHLPRAEEQICKALSNEDGMLGHFRKRMVSKTGSPAVREIPFFCVSEYGQRAEMEEKESLQFVQKPSLDFL